MSTSASPSWLESDCLSLARLDTLRARNDLYLRLLYSSQCGAVLHRLMQQSDAGIPARTLALLQSIDRNLLAREQAARQRGLRQHILREIPYLKRLLASDVLPALIAQFLESDTFWQARARSLGENFCLFSVEQAACPIAPLERDLIRLCGIVAGLSAAPQAPGPWPQEAGSDPNEPLLQGALATETFLSRWRLLNEFGGLPGLAEGTMLEDAFPPIASRVVIAALPARKVVAFTLEV